MSEIKRYEWGFGGMVNPGTRGGPDEETYILSADHDAFVAGLADECRVICLDLFKFSKAKDALIAERDRRIGELERSLAQINQDLSEEG